MTNTFEVTINTRTEVHTLPGIWGSASLRQLLILMELEDLAAESDSDLLDLVLMSLQDLEHQHAGERVLETVFGETMKPGVRQNLVDDLRDEEPWQDFSSVGQQRGIFTAVVLMAQAFPNRYPTPDAISLGFTVRALAESGKSELRQHNPAWIVRLLACGMQESDILQRLYEVELKGGSFSDAAGIIWHLEQRSEHEFEIISSMSWLAPLKRLDTFRARTI